MCPLHPWSHGAPINIHNVPTPSTRVVGPMDLQSTYTMYPLHPQQLFVLWSSNQHTQCTHSIHSSWWSYGPPINIHNVPTPPTIVGGPMDLQSTYTMYPFHPQKLVVLWTSNQHTQSTNSIHNSLWSYGPPINIHKCSHFIQHRCPF